LRLRWEASGLQARQGVEGRGQLMASGSVGRGWEMVESLGKTWKNTLGSTGFTGICWK